MIHSITSSTAMLCAFAVTALSVVSSVSAHGYLSSPTPRGIEKLSYQIDDLKSPNTKGICRDEPAGKVTNVGHSVTLGFTITAPHIGMCEVYILDENLGNARKIASKKDCVATGKVGSWTVNIPSDISGRKVLRWKWDAAHLKTTIEHYEQCADINISGGGGGGSSDSSSDDDGSSDSYDDDSASDSSSDSKSSKSSKSNKKKSSKSTDDESNTPSSSDATDEGYESSSETKKSDVSTDADSTTSDTTTTEAEATSSDTSATETEADSSSSSSSSSSSGGDGCQDGEFKCEGNKVGQCSSKKFNWVTCASGTTCKKTAYAIYCG
ncbi:hypothetical protein BDF22DRAFT_773667 [Syncephalis plumigaleata]|nr:hypothetical protein BDF22DRAFT_773667 [Syncephalis plumigaleata]